MCIASASGTCLNRCHTLQELAVGVLKGAAAEERVRVSGSCNVYQQVPRTSASAGTSRRDVEGGSSLNEEERIRFWSSDNVPVNVRDRLISSLTDVYIQLDNLVKFVELNHDGFR